MPVSLVMRKTVKMVRHPELFMFYITQPIWEYALKRKKRMVVRIEKDGEIFYQYKNVLYPGYLNKGGASVFIQPKASSYCSGRGIDVGAAAWPLPGAIPILDEVDQNAYKLDAFPDQSLDYVFSSHCLEHLLEWKSALKLWIRKLKAGGVLFLYLPHKSMVLWKRGGPWTGYEHQWVPDVRIINRFLVRHGMKIIEYEPNKDEHWSFYVVARKAS